MPSAYASGALVKCRKVGAAKRGNKSESVDVFDPTGDSPDSNTRRTDRINDKRDKVTPRRRRVVFLFPPNPV